MLDLPYRFKDNNFLSLALTHKSCRGSDSNERLEFLGDAVVYLVVSDLLYKNPTHLLEKHMSPVRASLVKEGTLSKVARFYQLDKYLEVSELENRSLIIESDRVLASAFEAIVGAVFLDGGFDSAYNFVMKSLEKEMAARDFLEGDEDDYKTKLQEYTMLKSRALPKYQIKEQAHLDPENRFLAQVFYKGNCVGQGVGRSHKKAEQNAARIALSKLKEDLG